MAMIFVNTNTVYSTLISFLIKELCSTRSTLLHLVVTADSYSVSSCGWHTLKSVHLENCCT